MRAARFFIDAPLASETRIELPPHVAHHAVRVLRLRHGDPLVLFNGTGGEFPSQLAIDGQRVFASILEFDAVERESPLSITLVQAWIATDKLDWVIEKSVELGVHSIILAPTQRSIVRLAEDRLAKRIERLREIIITACAQCGRNRIPHIEAESTFSTALQAALNDNAVGLLIQPRAQSPLAGVQLTSGHAALAVGPEGGFDDAELALAHRVGYHSYSLGPRILRTETAGITALATLQHLAGDLA
jgi:16S rRNA (uracil1498-N3)-methyltransferase